MPLSRVYVTVVLAMSADGKIADRDAAPARFSSSEDLARLETEIAKADAVLFGAGTLRAYGTCLPIRQPDLITQRQTHQKPTQPIQIVCSRSGRLDPNLRFFQQAVPRWLCTTAQGAKRWEKAPAFDRILQIPSGSLDWTTILQSFFHLGIQRLAVLGGGNLVGDLVHQHLIDELHLTVCPLLLGGRTAPTPADGVGLTADVAPWLQLIQAKTFGNEVFLHYRRCHRPRD